MEDFSKIVIEGNYLQVGSHLIPQTNSNHKLILHHRKEVTPKKPAQYVMLTTGGKPVYLSSLYPTEAPNTFILETGHRYYHLTMTGSGAEITPFQNTTNQASSDNCLCISLGNDAIRLRQTSNPLPHE